MTHIIADEVKGFVRIHHVFFVVRKGSIYIKKTYDPQDDTARQVSGISQGDNGQSLHSRCAVFWRRLTAVERLQGRIENESISRGAEAVPVRFTRPSVSLP